MRELNMAGIAAGLVSLIFILAAPATANAQNQLSDRSVQTIMNYAWNYTPEKFTKKDGKTIFIDKKNREKMTVPLVKGREIIMAGRLTAHAQACGLLQDMKNNFNSLMLREHLSKQWSEQQMVYINMLHFTTTSITLGTMDLIERDEGGKIVQKNNRIPALSCTDEQKEKVKELIEQYVAAGPDLSQSPENQ